MANFINTSSTQSVPDVGQVPKHVAIIMDGNGRWASKRFMPRVAGHSRGLEVVRRVVEYSNQVGVKYLTLFAFSSENWRRPPDEVSFLMNLFLKALEKEVDKLHRNNIRLRLIGDMKGFGEDIQARVKEAELKTSENTGLVLTIAANYGGRWDVINAVRQLLKEQPNLASESLDEGLLSQYLSMPYAPEPDLFIRTGGEQRISNFLLWQLAYTELYFTEILWPDFSSDDYKAAIESYSQRQRRFGLTGDQLVSAQHSKDS